MKKLLLLLSFSILYALPSWAQGTYVNGGITAVDTSATCSTAGGFVVINVSPNSSSVAFNVSGTFSGTLQFVGTVDGSRWDAVNAFPPNSTTAATSTTSGGTWKADVANFAQFCVRASAFASGTATVGMRTGSGVSTSTLGGGITTNSTGLVIRRLASIAQTNNPLINAPLGPAPAWAASTAYVAGQVVTNGSYQYLCNVAGTSAASGGPTGTSANLITDNTVSWYYYGLAMPGTASVNQPVITQSASVPGALTQTIAMNASPSPFYYAGGNVNVTGSAQYNFQCFVVIASTKSTCPARATFVTDAQKIAVKTTSSQNAIRYIVDGQYVTISGYVNGTGASPSYNIIDFTNSGTRKIHTITLEIHHNTQFGGISIGPTEEAWAPKTQDRIRVIWIGDSISSSGSNSPSIDGADVPYQVGLMLGWSDVWDASQGGIGYTNTNSGTGYTFGQQVTQTVAGNNPNVIVFMGSVNDVGTASATEQANALAAFQNARSLYPSVPIIVLGIWPDATGPSAGLLSTENDVKTAFTTWADSNSYFIPIANDPVQAWMTGTGRVNSTTGTGNSDMYTASDAVHPTDMGRSYEAQREAQAIRNILPLIP